LSASTEIRAEAVRLTPFLPFTFKYRERRAALWDEWIQFSDKQIKTMSLNVSLERVYRSHAFKGLRANVD
jgi:hypothetical protein